MRGALDQYAVDMKREDGRRRPGRNIALVAQEVFGASSLGASSLVGSGGGAEFFCEIT